MGAQASILKQKDIMTISEIKELLDIKERERKEYQKAFEQAYEYGDWEHIDQYYESYRTAKDTIINLKSKLNKLQKYDTTLH